MSKLWGSRFEKGTDKLADEFSFSISYDKKLAIFDIIGSIAHAQMLGKCQIISKNDEKKIVAGLKKIGDRVEKGTFRFDLMSEDIHSNIQDELKRQCILVINRDVHSLANALSVVPEKQAIREIPASMLQFSNRSIAENVILPAYLRLMEDNAIS